ncbi:MAG: YhjD/YihY/BrkB family envelope integrity protein [Methylotenera sp.]|uniref:YhjD/YihY/BrkB family envelope integrity protein n=1 Tax=Methylotenera sp. TaxID=2051956 RepID=UPI0024899C10|nr:YhjD/YihY/BrkB family envelope integrity protein [Methylotenera sp.]MDI1309648.1 YhjD/YihY/BrkB family envelope integrity protein [Methylotenera sp.]
MKSEEANIKQQSTLQSAINKPREAYDKQRYSTPLFVLHEMFGAFRRHNVLGLSASLSFYALFALIPLVLLLFFLLSHLVFTSDYAVVELAIITGNLVPRFSSAIMVEVYNTAQQKAAWGAAGLFVLLWTVTPLASAMRTSFYTIASLVEAPSFIRRKIKDIIAVIGMLILFFLFTFAGFMLEKVITFLGANHQFFQYDIIAALTSLVVTTLLIAIFYFAFFPVKLILKHILIGSLFTAVLWLLMRPAFTLFLSLNESYGSVFGSMKNLFISITWLYFNISVFLLGTELIATLRKKDVLILRGLFADNQQEPQSKSQTNYLEKLMQRYGRSYQQGELIFKLGDLSRNMHYLVSGEIQLLKNGILLRTITAGEYFGEMAMLTNKPAIADAVVSSNQADVILIYPDNIETLLLDEPKVAMKFLREMAARLQMHSDIDVS